MSKEKWHTTKVKNDTKNNEANNSYHFDRSISPWLSSKLCPRYIYLRKHKFGFPIGTLNPQHWVFPTAMESKERTCSKRVDSDYEDHQDGDPYSGIDIPIPKANQNGSSTKFRWQDYCPGVPIRKARLQSGSHTTESSGKNMQYHTYQ